MKLYDLIKTQIEPPKGVISDKEMVVLNRRDFLYSETSATQFYLSLFHAQQVSYEMYSIIDYIHSSVSKISPPTEVNIFQMSKSMTLPALAVSVFVGTNSKRVRAHAPRGVQGLQAKDSFAKELGDRFQDQLNSGLEMSSIGTSKKTVDIIVCNASNEAEVVSALQAFTKVQRGFIIIKGYGRIDAPNCGEIILSARLNVHCSLSGFGVCTAL